jgi:hypothetical protein
VGRVPAVADERTDALTDAELGDSGTDPRDVTDDVEPLDLRESARGEASTGRDVVERHPRGLHGDQDLPGAGFGHRHGLHLEHLRTSRGGQSYPSRAGNRGHAVKVHDYLKDLLIYLGRGGTTGR